MTKVGGPLSAPLRDKITPSARPVACSRDPLGQQPSTSRRRRDALSTEFAGLITQLRLLPEMAHLRLAIVAQGGPLPVVVRSLFRIPWEVSVW